MEKSLRKNGRFIAFVAYCLAAIAVLTVVTFFNFRAPAKAAVPAQNLVVVLDAGHGGVDGGVVGESGVKESHLNLLMTKQIKKRLEARGATVVLTRLDENGLYGDATKGFKLRDMKKRREIIRAASPDLVISVHMNKFSDANRRGPQVFFQRGDKESKRFADNIQTALNAFVGNDKHAALSGDFFICQCAPVPSVIVECGFLSNKEEERLLLNADYREQLSESIVRGVFLYLYSK